MESHLKVDKSVVMSKLDVSPDPNKAPAQVGATLKAAEVDDPVK